LITEYFKYHALGNDYIVIDPNKTNINMNTKNIRLICHRNFGIGSDGILYGPIIEGGNIRLRIFNPDGSEAEKSGNGIRIFSRYLLEAGYVRGGSYNLETMGGQVQVTILAESGEKIKVDMGTVTFASQHIPVAGQPREVVNEHIKLCGESYSMTCLSIGNPHCVIPLAEISEDMARTFGPQVESHSLFPNRINMQLLKVLDRGNIQIEIWERGAGYTLASGSSSCAAACAAFRLGLVGRDIRVHMPGGVIDVQIGSDGHVMMTGSVSSVANGRLSNEFIGLLHNDANN
jgi:diaminopimelate epimerase